MPKRDLRQLYPYRRSPDQDAAQPARHPVVVVGAGPVGLTLALDLALRNVPVLLLDESEGVGGGSRAICFAKRTLEIADRLGAAGPMMEKGVVWNLGKVFHDERLVYEFNLLPEGGHQFPAFINLQQPYFEQFLFDRLMTAREAGAPVEIRGGNRVESLAPTADGVALTVGTPEGAYALQADWVVACDGARSPLRGMLGLGFEGRVFEDSFLIVDVRMDAPFPTERWFWFEPHFKSGASALLHKQPDDEWRIDFQLGWNVDREVELRPDNIRRRLDAMLGPKVGYEIVWSSIYTFQCRRMERFRHGRVLFAGDSAHQVSPFGARGANSGVQDAENLAWKLDYVLRGLAPDALLDTYSDERVQAADENILNSTRSTDFITPKSPMSRVFRDAALSLAADAPFARTLVNSGRLSVPCIHDGSPLNGPDCAGMPARTRPGAPACDTPIPGGWLLQLLGGGFTILAIDAEVPPALDLDGVTLASVSLSAAGNDMLRERWLGSAGSAVYLIRPDQHVAARWTRFEEREIRAALAKALCR